MIRPSVAALALALVPAVASAAGPNSVVQSIQNRVGTTFQRTINDGSVNIPESTCDTATHTCVPVLGSVLQSTKGMSLTGAPVYPATPTGNALNTLTGLNVQLGTTAAATREYGVMFGMVANTGDTAGTAGPGDKATLYVGMRCLYGAIACWSTNPLTAVEGPIDPSFYSAYVNEFDYNLIGMTDTGSKNILGQASGAYETYGKVNLSHVVYVGNTTLSGYADVAGVHANFGIVISGSNQADGSALFDRGVWFPNLAGSRLADIQSDDAAQSVVADFGTHTRGLDISGTYSNVGIDLSRGSYGGTPLLLPNNTAVQYLAADGTTRLSTIFVNNGNTLILGQGSPSIELGSNTFPLSDNGQALGTTGLAYSQVATHKILLSTGSQLQWQTAAGGSASALYVDSGNPNALTHLGAGTASIVLETNAFPTADNAQALGTGTLAFSQVAAHAYYAGTTAGVSCTGAPTPSFATTDGLTTHC